MESIISYFGTYKPAADGAVASFKFEYLCTLGFAAIVIFLGRAIVAPVSYTHLDVYKRQLFPFTLISSTVFLFKDMLEFLLFINRKKDPVLIRPDPLRSLFSSITARN